MLTLDAYGLARDISEFTADSPELSSLHGETTTTTPLGLAL